MLRKNEKSGEVIKMERVFSSIVVVFLLLVFVVSPAKALSYIENKDGLWFDLCPGRAYGINDAGYTVGYSIGGNQQVKWKSWDLDGKGSDVGVDGQFDSHGYALNNRGDMVGWVEISEGGPKHPFVWTEESGLKDLLDSSDPNDGGAFDINNGGTIVGWAIGRSVGWGTYWDIGGMFDLGSLGGSRGQAHGINDSGQIVGWSETATVLVDAFIWTQDGGISSAGLTLTCDSNDTDSEAYDISDNDMRVGRSGIIDRGTGPFDANSYTFSQCRPVAKWTVSTGFGYSEVTAALGTLGGNKGCAYAANNAREVVGYSTTTGDEEHAFLWTERDGMIDLNGSFPTAGSWTMAVGRDINLLGSVAGWGTIGAEEHAFLMVPKRLWRAVLYSNPDGTGQPSIYSGNYDLLEETLTGEEPEKVYCASGYDTLDGHNIEFECEPIVIGETLSYLVNHIKQSSENPITKATAQYNDKGQILQVTQVNKDPSEPNDVITFTYDDRRRLTKVELMKGGPIGALMGGLTLGDYCDDCPRSLRKRPRRCVYSNLTDPNKNLEVQADYDTQGRLVSLRYNRSEFDHIGQFNFGYDPNGKPIIISYLEDKDGNGSCETPVVSGTFTYDANGRLTKIYDTVSDSNILEWDRTADTENIILRSIFGDPNVDTITTAEVDAPIAEAKVIISTVNGSEDVRVTIPEDGNLPVQVRNWNWSPEAQGEPNLVSADVIWGRLFPELADPNISDRVLLTLLNDDGLLAGTINAKELSICTYASPDRKKGGRISCDGTLSSELHFYKKADDGSVLSMLTVDEYGNITVGIAGGANEQPDMSFFNSWTCHGPAGPPMGPRWGGNIGEYDDYVGEIYSGTGDGTAYIAGTVTPDGVYRYFQYNENGDIEAIIQMNEVAEARCTEEIPGDVNGDCKVDFTDVATMAINWLKCNLEPPEACWN